MAKGVIIACSNNKGGSGKTCCSVTLAHALANRGQRVLVCDLDTQCNATALLLSPGNKTKTAFTNSSRAKSRPPTASTPPCTG